MKKHLIFGCLASLLLFPGTAKAVVKEKLVDNYNDIKRAEEFVSATHLSGEEGSANFLEERLKEINRLKINLKTKINNPEHSIDEADNLKEEEIARFKRSRNRLSDSIRELSAKGVASVEAYGKDFIKYKDGKVLRINKGLIVSVENEKNYDKRGNKYVKDTTDIVYDDLKRIIAYKEETLSPDGKTKTVVTKTNTVYYTSEDEEINYRALQDKPASFTEISKTYNAETGAYISGTKKDWSSIQYYGKDDSQGSPAYIYGQMSSYTLTDYVNVNSNAVGSITKTADIQYVHRLKYINELTIGGQVSDSELTESERYEYLVTGYRENYKPVGVAGTEQTSVLENIKYNDYGEFYSYTERVKTADYTFTRTVNKIEYDSFGNVLTVDDTSNISFNEGFFEQFSRDYSTDAIFSDAAIQTEFIAEYLEKEGAFHEGGISYSELNGMTYDSYNLNSDTGGVIGKPNQWSAASNESLHIQILAAAIAGDNNAAIFVSPDDPTQAAAKALEILTLKMSTLEQFYTANPKYAGFVPWFTHYGLTIQPSDDWLDRVPALDNGQLAWSMIMAEEVLRNTGQVALADRYKVYWERMAANAKDVFYDGNINNKIRGEASITDAGPGVWTYGNNVPGYELVDPYEGELMVIFMSLFSTLTAPEVTALWANKSMTSRTYTTVGGDNITVRTGHWYSAHEMWNFFVLPYTDDPLIAEVFRLGEIARTAYSAENLIPGLYASVNPPEGSVPAGVTYASACGIASLASNAIDYPNIITPYAAFPVILADQGAGLSWLVNMLQGAKAQGPYGTTESITVDGTSIANVLSWDSKAILVNSLVANTIQSSMRTVMQNKGVYGDFLTLLNTEYTDTFTNLASLEGSHLSLFKPTQSLPRPTGINDFYDTANIFQGVSFAGSGNLSTTYTFDSSNNSLYLPEDDGFVYASIDPVDVSVNGILSIRVLTTDNLNISIELKNNNEQIITDKKIRLFMPNTRGVFRTFSVDLSALISVENANVSTFVIADPTGALTLDNAFFRSTSLTGMNFLRAKPNDYEFFGARSIVNTEHELNVYTSALRVNSYVSNTGGYVPSIRNDITDTLFEAAIAKSTTQEVKSQSSYKTSQYSSEFRKIEQDDTYYNQDFDDKLNNKISPMQTKSVPVYRKGSPKATMAGGVAK